MSNGLFQTRSILQRRRRLGALLPLALPALCVGLLLAQGRTAQGFDQDLARLNRFVQSGDSPAMLIFRQGRDLIEKEDWAGAAAKFEGYVAQYPRSKDVDAALYWLAYSLKKQRRFQDAEQVLERLAREFPRSTWADDARAMQVEIAPQVGKRVDPEGFADDELKIVALQSLFQSDPSRASAYVAEILKPGSKASRELKETAVTLLGHHGGSENVGMLLDIARTQPDPELRGIAVHRLGQFGERVVDDLMKIYETERDDEVRARVLHAFSQINSPRATAKLVEIARGGDNLGLRTQAIHWLGQRRDAQVADELMRILSADRSDEVRGSILHALSQMNEPRARARLLEVARGGDSAELRGQAIHWLGQNDDAASVEELVKLYDTEREGEVKNALLHAFSRSKQEAALLKLMDVARRDPDRELRKQAVHWLGQSRDPRALKFIQDLLR